jgi:hypothetical protein
MDEQDRDSTERSERSAHEGSSAPEDRERQQPQPAPEVHRERELIVTGGGRRSGPGTVVMVIFAFVALIVVGLLAFTFLDRDGGSIIPDELDINIQVPEVPGGTGGTGSTDGS